MRDKNEKNSKKFKNYKCEEELRQNKDDKLKSPFKHY